MSLGIAFYPSQTYSTKITRYGTVPIPNLDQEALHELTTNNVDFYLDRYNNLVIAKSTDQGWLMLKVTPRAVAEYLGLQNSNTAIFIPSANIEIAMKNDFTLLHEGMTIDGISYTRFLKLAEFGFLAYEQSYPNFWSSYLQETWKFILTTTLLIFIGLVSFAVVYFLLYRNLGHKLKFGFKEQERQITELSLEARQLKAHTQKLLTTAQITTDTNRQQLNLIQEVRRRRNSDLKELSNLLNVSYSLLKSQEINTDESAELLSQAIVIAGQLASNTISIRYQDKVNICDQIEDILSCFMLEKHQHKINIKKSLTMSSKLFFLTDALCLKLLLVNILQRTISRISDAGTLDIGISVEQKQFLVTLTDNGYKLDHDHESVMKNRSLFNDLIIPWEMVKNLAKRLGITVNTSSKNRRINKIELTFVNKNTSFGGQNVIQLFS